MEKSGKIKRNILSSIICQVVTIGIGFVLPMLYIDNFGSQTNGILSVIKQIFTYLALLEAGIGVASAQALYKPVAENDRDDINGILAATRYFYMRTGIIFAVCVSLIAVGYSAYVYKQGYEIGWYVVGLLVVLNALPSLISYFLQLKYQVFLEIDGRRYVITNSQTVLQVVSGFAKVAVLLLTNSLILMQLTYALCAVGQLLFITVYTRKKYPWLNFKVPQKKSAVSQKNSVLVHQISSMIFNNTDIILLSFLCDPVASSIYYIYNLFFYQVENFITGIISGFHFALGQRFATDRETFDREFNVYELVFIVSNFIIYTLMCVFLLPIIRIYTQGERDGVLYVFPLVMLLFSLSKMISSVKTACGQVIEYSGSFRRTRWHAVCEASINIVTTISCVLIFNRLYGAQGAICGALAGTIAASLFRTFASVIFTNVCVLKRNVFKTFIHPIVNFFVFGVVFAILKTDTFLQNNFGQLVLHGILNSLWIVPAYIVANAVVHPKLTKEIAGYIKNRFLSKKKSEE